MSLGSPSSIVYYLLVKQEPILLKTLHVHNTRVGFWPFPETIRLCWKKLAMDKHSSLLHKFLNYGRKKFNNIGTWSGARQNWTSGFDGFIGFCPTGNVRCSNWIGRPSFRLPPPSNCRRRRYKPSFLRRNGAIGKVGLSVWPS